MKLKIFMDDITKHNFFGPIVRVVYTIEFQKRGFPHVHLILWLRKDKPLDAEQIDAFISAQLPNPSIDLIGYEVVSKFMIHGPCGTLNPSSPCMADGACTKFYPKEFCNKTTVLPNGHFRYARPDNGITTEKNDVNINNRFVVPHNVDLLVKYQAHINVEAVNRDGMEKYLFKYTTKGPDCSIVGIKRKRNNSDPSAEQINEIRDYLDCRTITPIETAWRLLQFDIHYTDPAVELLPVHLPLENNVLYTEDDYLEEVIQNPRNAVTKLTAWFVANRTYPRARQHTYVLSSLSISHGMQIVKFGNHGLITAPKLVE
uniref:Helitron helicase-like domain-containing protein n=1 Tax=Arundo donax TaxID=35708 RepID=A0A0A9DMA7_ARUDO